MTLPKFDNYEEEGRCDNGYESIQDFFLSWTIRCSPAKYKNANSKVQEYARRIVYALIFGYNQKYPYSIDKPIPESFQVIDVTTKRQLSSIDLLAEVTTCEIGIEKKYVLSIENKWYSKLTEGQLGKYNAFVQINYQGINKVNLFITCDDQRKNYEWEKKECMLNNYKYLTIGDLFSISKMSDDGPTGNALFDAYWFENKIVLP